MAVAVAMDVETFVSLFLLRYSGIRRLNRIVSECRYDLRFRGLSRIGRFSGVELRRGTAATGSITSIFSLGKTGITERTYSDGQGICDAISGDSSGGDAEGGSMGVLLLRSATGFGGGIGLGALLAHLGAGGGGRSGGHSSKLLFLMTVSYPARISWLVNTGADWIREIGLPGSVTMSEILWLEVGPASISSTVAKDSTDCLPAEGDDRFTLGPIVLKEYRNRRPTLMSKP